MQSVKIIWHKDIGISATKAVEGAYVFRDLGLHYFIEQVGLV
jgi:hypothetical protein